ncbi:MAG TPA: NADP-dependent phosphogluconate dehydrogenase [Phycisphaerae bacterium]|nr:NADP-dependent phosphogluconate dehydrogenase [Phycisphaerae bacterium]
MAKQQVGLVGLAVMGQNLALNIESKGFSVAVFNRTGAKTERFMAERAAGKAIVGTYHPKEFCAALQTPRKIILMVKAGEAVDATIGNLRPHLGKGDVLIDGGNSFFKDTERRLDDLAAAGLLYIGTGVSGGEEGALLGPSIMPGGSRKAYALVKNVLEKCAAQVDGPCCTYIGPRGAGHFVKMVHNGIEYGIMQVIAEIYDVLQDLLHLTAAEVSMTFSKWNKELGGYLMEITSTCLARVDDDTGKPLVDLILDKAGQKGTGKWTSQNALDLGVAVPTIDMAVEARILSAFKDERVAAAKVLKGPRAGRGVAHRTQLIRACRDALYASVIVCYAQGMALLREASREYDYDLHLDEVARIWKGGCIIRSKLLDPIAAAYCKKPDLANLMVDTQFARILNRRTPALRKVVCQAVGAGVPVLALSSALGYIDSYRTARLPQNLTQAQRDYFGAHTYARTDKEGVFHTHWTA